MTRLDELTQKANEFNSIIKSIKEYSKDRTMTQDIKDSLTHWRKLLLDTLAEIKTIETNSKGKLIYTYTFPFVDFTGLKLGLGDEGVVAFKDMSELTDDSIHSYATFNKKQFQTYITKSLSGEIKHRVSYPFKIGEFKLSLKLIEQPIQIGDVIVHIDAKNNQGTIIKISTENETFITNFFEERKLTAQDLSKSFMLVNKSNQEGVGELWSKEELDNIHFSEEFGFSTELYTVNLKLNTTKL